jgi:benzil reductase ((S)-benzoin forming)
MNYFLVTGSSKGFGRAVVNELLKNENNFVFGISRSELNDEKNYRHINFNLENLTAIVSCVEEIFTSIDIPNSIFLINNAGVIEPISLVGSASSLEIISHFNVNSLAPIIFTSEFLKRVKVMKIKRGVFNISTGASKNAYAGWSCYCSSKAALSMFTECVRLELPHDMVIESYDPGVIDTGIQTLIRSKTDKEFPEVNKFHDFHREARLQTPQDAGARFVQKYFNDYL